MFKSIFRYKLVWMAVSVFVTMLLGTFVPLKTFVIVAIGIGAFGLVLSIILRFREKKLAIYCFSAILVSAAVFFGYTKIFYQPVISFTGEQVVIEGTSQTMISKSTNYHTAVINCNRVTVLDAEKGDKSYDINFKVRIYFTKTDEFEASAKLKFNGNIFGSVMRYGGDRSKGIFVTAFGTSYEVVEPADKKSLTYNFANFQQGIKDRLSFGDDRVGAFMKGMILGDKSEIDDKLNDAFTEAGLQHVLSVSGMHLTFAIVFLNGFLTFLGVQYRHTDVISIVAAIFFTALVGFPLPCIRSAIMLIVYYSARLFRRDPDSLTSLAAAVLLICITMPFSVRDVGFLLSASATGGIILLAPEIDHMILPGFYFKHSVVQGIYRASKYAFAVSLGANVACIPVLVLAFGRISLIAPVCSTVLSIPIQIAFDLGIVGLLISFWPWGYELISKVIGLVYEVIESMIYFFASLKFASVGEAYVFFYFVVIVGLVTFGCALYFQRKYDSFRVGALACSFVIFTTSLYGYDAYMTRGIIYASFVNVGQGDSAVIMKNSKAVVIDCGGANSGIYELKAELQRQDVDTIEYILLTHLHSDHCDYLEEIVKYYEVENIIYPGGAIADNDEEFKEAIQYARMEGANIITEKEDRTIEVLGSAQIHVYTEQADFDEGGNESCYAYMLEYGETKVLYTGDMQLATERKLLDEYGEDELDCDILKVAHHGSKTSSSTYLLNAVTPQTSVISVGIDNNYGHPNNTVLKRLSEYSTNIFRTDIDSTVRFKISKNSYKVEGMIFDW